MEIEVECRSKLAAEAPTLVPKADTHIAVITGGVLLCLTAVVGCDLPPKIEIAGRVADGGVTPGGGAATGPASGDDGPPSDPAVAIDDALAVAAGGASSCALRPQGEVWCWGLAGQGTKAAKASDERAGRIELSGATALALGQWSVCAMVAGGRVACQVGGGVLPRGEVAGLTGVAALSVGWDHVCALDEAGRVWCWGANGEGQAGRAPSRAPVSPPAQVPGLPRMVQVSAGGERTCACTADGAVWCWGDRDPAAAAPARVEGIPRAVEVAVRGNRACLRQPDGGVTCWRRLPARPPEAVAGVSRATALALGDDFACALRDDGRVLCWGDNESGQLGRDTRDAASHPAGEVGGLSDVTALSAGQEHVCARTRSGRVACWGESFEGQTGRRIHWRSPTPIGGLTDVVEVGIGAGQACGRAADGRMSCWGRDSAGRCRGGPVALEGSAGSVQVAVGGGGRLCILGADGRVACGNDAPPRDLGLTATVELAAGNEHFCARHDDGGVSCWGDNELGQLGDGTTAFRKTPERVPGLDEVSRLVAAADRTCVLQRDQTLCFGRGPVAGDPDGGPTTRPTVVDGLGRVSDLFASARAVCARHSDDVVSCWGETQPQREHPPAVLGVALPGRLRALSTAGLQTCAVMEGGELRCWRTYYTETFTGAGVPVAPPGVARARTVGATGGTTCAVTEAGGVVCWGSNHHGLVVPAEPCFHTDPNEVLR